MADFGDGTAKSGAIPELDGWGYRHSAYNSDRQTAASINAENNELAVNGVQQIAGGTLSFIPGNVDELVMPESGKLIYKFKAKVAGGVVDYGFTSAKDGSYAEGVAWTTVSAKISDDLKDENGNFESAPFAENKRNLFE